MNWFVKLGDRQLEFYLYIWYICCGGKSKAKAEEVKTEVYDVKSQVEEALAMHQNVIGDIAKKAEEAKKAADNLTYIALQALRTVEKKRREEQNVRRA